MDLKKCGKCGETKPLEEFPRHYGSPTGRYARCKVCHSAANSAAYHALTPEQKIERSRKGAPARNKWRQQPHVKAQEAALNKAWQAENRDWRNFTGNLNRRGLTVDGYHAIMERQDFCCAICRCELTSGPRDTAIDHCHDSGYARGILCTQCNIGIGFLKESPMIMHSAAGYIQDWQERRCHLHPLPA
jgi:hypothetical protein